MELRADMTLRELKRHCTVTACRTCKYARREEYVRCSIAGTLPGNWELTEIEEPAPEPVQGEDALRAYVKSWENNPVSPAHYQQGARQTLDEMVLIFGIEAVKAFCLCNVYKYKTRAGLKNGQEDLAKADRYLTFYEHLCEYGRVKWEELEE